jgi:hypothetical protein
MLTKTKASDNDDRLMIKMLQAVQPRLSVPPILLLHLLMYNQQKAFQMIKAFSNFFEEVHLKNESKCFQPFLFLTPDQPTRLNCIT